MLLLPLLLIRTPFNLIPSSVKVPVLSKHTVFTKHPLINLFPSNTYTFFSINFPTASLIAIVNSNGNSGGIILNNINKAERKNFWNFLISLT